MDEVEVLIKDAYACYRRNKNTANLTLILNFELGLRVGELAAIRLTDIDMDNGTIWICRQEDTAGIEEYVKGESKAGKRQTKTQPIKKLRALETKLKYEEAKGTYCIRRTVASVKNADGIPLDEIRRWLGHTTKETTLKYIFNPYREDKTAELSKVKSILTNCIQLHSNNSPKTA